MAKKIPKVRLKSLADIRRFLARLINECRRGEVDPGLATKIGYLINILTGIIKDSDIEARITKLEETLNGKPKT